MRVVDKKTFLDMPEGTLYAKYSTPWNFGELAIKVETWTNDWWYTDILAWPKGCDGSNDLIDNIAKYEKESQFELESSSRDGLYEKEQLFAVYDQTDLAQLIDKLKTLIDA